MRFQETAIPGAFVIDPEPNADERGFFARTWCREEFRARGLATTWAQCAVSYNRRRGTLRGLHYQAEPYSEIKLVRCTAGAVHDVIVDLRPGSAAFGRWAAVELSARNRRMLYVPAGVAHGFQALLDDTEVFYQISELYRPELQRGARWDDPALGIAWPACDERIVSPRDQAFPELSPCQLS
jgi:dTDP-4-dehydrorhamnose 3,5-epimerase